MSQPSTFFARRALLILVVIFFLIPFGIRGARFAVQGMKNDVKDWLPSDYRETAELDWFRKHFVSEQFVIVSWSGCFGDATDERYRLFMAKLEPETPPSQRKKKLPFGMENPAGEAAPAGQVRELSARDDNSPIRLARFEGEAPATGEVTAADAPGSKPSEQAAAGDDGIRNPTRVLTRGPFIGDTYGLYTVSSQHENWGHQKERWLKGSIFRADSTGKSTVAESKWFYITPNGDLYLWNVVDAPLASLWRLWQHRQLQQPVTGELIHSFGPEDGPWYYENPRRLRAQLFKSVTTGPDVYANLVREGGVLADDHDEAARRLSGTMFGADGRQTCLLVTLTDVARRDLHQMVGRGMLGKPRGRLYEIAEECSIPAHELRLGGPPIDNVAIDEEGTITLVRLIGMCAVLGIGLSYLCFRSLSVTMMVFFVGGTAAMLSLAFIYWSGSSVDAITMSMPALVYVLGLSGAAHIINYYQDAVDNHGPDGAPEAAVKHGWKPTLLCNVTTAIGLISLYTSEIVPIRKFGIFSAMGVMATVIILFTYLPSALQIWPTKRRAPVKNDRGDWLNSYLSGFWQSVGGFCIRYHYAVAAACIAFIAATGYGVVYTQTSVNLLKMFHSEAKIIKDYAWLEDNLGRLVPMEIVLSVDPSLQLPSAREREGQAPAPEQQFQLSFLERMELANQVQQVVEEEFGPNGTNVVGRAMSAATFAPRLPKAKGDTSTFARRGATGRLLETHRSEFLDSDYLSVDKDNGQELWRVSLRLAATQGIDYGAFVNDLKQAVEPVLTAHECRQTVLRALAQQKEGQRTAGSSIALLGVPKSAVPGGSTDAEGESKPKTGVDSAAQSKIFAKTLIDLFNVSRLRVRAHVPEVSQTTPEQFDEMLASVDCVVLVGNAAGYDLAAIRAKSKLVIDATDHIFDARGATALSARDRSSKVAAVYTGVVPIVYKAQRALLESLIQSTFWSFITITPLMMFVARGFWPGLVAMLPNVLPVLVIFGGMGWLGIDVDVGSMMTASIALGVAVDDTIHYLNWFREELDNVDGDRHKAILGAYKHCATPTVQAAVISGLGLSVFALSTFTPTQRFGLLMLAILWAGVLAELIFFPALLAGPLGLVFRSRKKKQQQQVASESRSVVNALGHLSAELPTTADGPTPVPTVDLPPLVPMPPPVQRIDQNAEPGKSHLKPGNREESPPPSGNVPPANMGRSRAAVLRILRQDRPPGETS